VWSTPERIRGEVLMTMRYTNWRLPYLTFALGALMHAHRCQSVARVWRWESKRGSYAIRQWRSHRGLYFVCWPRNVMLLLEWCAVGRSRHRLHHFELSPTSAAGTTRQWPVTTVTVIISTSICNSRCSSIILLLHNVEEEDDDDDDDDITCYTV